MSEPSLSERINTVDQRLESIMDKIGHMESFLEKLPERYKTNGYYNRAFEQGNHEPHDQPTLKGKKYKCQEGHGPWPHLYHTFNPQLNNITDMINYLIQNCCCKEQQQQIIPEKSQVEIKFQELLKEIQEKSDFIQKKESLLNQLEELLKHQKKQEYCLTPEQLQQFLSGGGGSSIISHTPTRFTKPPNWFLG